MIRRITVETGGQGLHEFTSAVQDAVRGAKCTVFVQHTSASLAAAAAAAALYCTSASEPIRLIECSAAPRS